MAIEPIQFLNSSLRVHTNSWGRLICLSCFNNFGPFWQVSGLRKYRFHWAPLACLIRHKTLEYLMTWLPTLWFCLLLIWSELAGPFCATCLHHLSCSLQCSWYLVACLLLVLLQFTWSEPLLKSSPALARTFVATNSASESTTRVLYSRRSSHESRTI